LERGWGREIGRRAVEKETCAHGVARSRKAEEGTPKEKSGENFMIGDRGCFDNFWLENWGGLRGETNSQGKNDKKIISFWKKQYDSTLKGVQGRAVHKKEA